MLPQAKRNWLTRRELAEREGVTVHTVDRWIHKGVGGVLLGVRYVGGLVRIPVANVDLFNRLIAQRRGVAAPVAEYHG